MHIFKDTHIRYGTFATAVKAHGLRTVDHQVSRLTSPPYSIQMDGLADVRATH